MEILEIIKEISQNVLPILGVIALIVVIVLLFELIKTVKNANNVLSKSKGTVDLVDESIKKVQAPLDSMVKVSHSVDVAHDATVKGLENAKEFISKNADTIKEKINELGKKQEASVEPNDDDTEDNLKGV